MDRKLTEKEIEFLTELRELMSRYNVLLGAENDTVSIDIDFDEDTEESILLPAKFNAFYNIDELIIKNS